MANAIGKRHGITLHQALHGYADGHRQLATSAKLTQRDAKTLLVFSDISGPGTNIDECGYLTGFPLAESGVYALARTWPAPEMSRPGCVWTHTLLIDFADLATISSLDALGSLFRRPEISAYSGYGKVTIFAEHQRDQSLTRTEQAWGQRLLMGLYGKPRSRITAVPPNGVDVEAIVLAIWGQQWPRLRRAFRFCTWAAADRSSESQHFDLQLLPRQERSTRTRFQGAVDVETLDTAEGSWLGEAVLDMVEPDVQGLRSFLHRIGGDVVHGRSGFQPLCRLHELIGYVGKDPRALGAAVALLDDQFEPGEARGARALVTHAGIANAHDLDHVVLEFLLRNIGLVDADSLKAGAEHFGREIWKQDPRLLLPLLEGDEVHRIIPERAVACLQVDELLSGLRRSHALIKPVIERRPEIVEQPAFWAINGVDSELAMLVLSSVNERELTVVEAIVTAKRHDLAPRCVRQFGAFKVMQAVASQAGQGGEEMLVRWVSEAANDRNAVADFLSSETPIPTPFLVALSRHLDPDAVPNDYGLDPWWLAMERATGNVSVDDEIFLSAYLFCRALGRVSRNPAELACLGFEATHRAVESNRLPSEVWQTLERKLPMSFLWFDWDRCPRLRSAVIDLFVDRRLAPEVFAHLVNDDRLFAELIDEACRTFRSRRFLFEVCQMLEYESADSSRRRVSYLRQVLHIEN